MTRPQQACPWRRQADGGCQGEGTGGAAGGYGASASYGASAGSVETFWHQWAVMLGQVKPLRTTEFVHLKMEDFMLCELHLDKKT